jgi:ubiquinone/menaquinone biosynthesis C-methylase UbiE
VTAPGGSVPFDRVAATYDATRGGMERGRRLAGVLAGLLPSQGTLLEIGVGTGAVSAGLAELGRDIVGVDLSRPMLAVARERLPGRVAAADALRLPVRTGSVAGACLIHVLHLVAEIPATLAEAARVLRRSGALVATGMATGPTRATSPRSSAGCRSGSATSGGTTTPTWSSGWPPTPASNWSTAATSRPAR